MDDIKNLARQAYRDQQSQDIEGGVPCSISFIAGFIEGYRKNESVIDENLIAADDMIRIHMEMFMSEIKKNIELNSKLNHMADLAYSGWKKYSAVAIQWNDTTKEIDFTLKEIEEIMK